MAHPRAGQPAEPADLVDVPRLVTAYYAEHPDPADPAQQVSFGTSGHRGSQPEAPPSTRTTSSRSPRRSATTGGQQGIDGPLFLGRDTHALSAPAAVSALEVLAANEVTVLRRQPRRLHPHPGRVARDPHPQPGPRPPASPTAS